MNWLKRNPLRASFSRPRGESYSGGLVNSSQTSRNTTNSELVIASFETFHKHWQQLHDIIKQDPTSADEDDILAITGHLEHLITLVSVEFQSNVSTSTSGASEVSSACLDFLLRADLFQEVLLWGSKTCYNRLLNLPLAQSMERLLMGARSTKSSCQIALLRHPALHKPIQQLLLRLENVELETGLETALVSLCFNVMVLITREPSFLDLFFDLAHLESGPRFPLMTVLVNCLYKGNELGQQSRDGLMLCMGLAKQNSFLSQYMAVYSSFCPVVATGLSGLYSALPRKLPESLSERGLITLHDVANNPDISFFVTALEFCDAVVGSAPWPVVGQLLNYFYSGFLVPVLGPALFQDALGLSVKALDSPQHVNTMEEILAATCYLTTCLKRVEQRPFLGTFIQFLLKENFEGKTIIDILVDRLSSASKLRLGTLHLFTVLVDLHCEDVMMHLVFKYLIPCGHVMQSQRGSTLHLKDFIGAWASKFLGCIPEACRLTATSKSFRDSEKDDAKSNRIRSWSNNSDSSGNEPSYGRLSFAADDRSTISRTESFKLSERQDFANTSRLRSYLNDARIRVEKCLTATQGWTYTYDGSSPSVQPPGKSESSEDDFDSTSSSSGIPAEISLGDQTAEEFYANAIEELNAILNEINLISPGRSSGYESFNFTLTSLDVAAESSSYLPPDLQRDLEFWSFMRDDDEVDLPKISTETTIMNDVAQHASPSVGPFLDQVIRAVDSWLSNNLKVNLALCSLISSLAAYPQPLLNSYLLNPLLVVQPSIPSLFSCLAPLKQRIDSALSNVEFPSSAIAEARAELERLAPSPGLAKSKQIEISGSTYGGDMKRRGSSISATLTSLLFKKSAIEAAPISESSLEVTPNGKGFRYLAKPDEIGRDPIGRHVALCAVLLEEWLHELAAFCLEHAASFKAMPIPKAQFT